MNLKKNSSRKPIDDSLLQEALDLKNAGDYAAAVRVLEKVVTRNPSSASGQCLLGAFYFHFLQAPSKALPHLKIGVRLSPKSEMASLGLFQCLWSMDRHDEALEEIKRFQILTNWSSDDYREIVAEINEKWTDEPPEKKRAKKPLAKSRS